MSGRPTALVTGAARGIGRRTAEVLAAAGYALALNDLVDPADTATAVAALGAPALPVPGDVTSEAVVLDLVQRAEAEFGAIDVLVNNAAMFAMTPAEDTSTELWRRVLEVNLTAPFLLARTVGRGMLDRRRGSIVNVSSVAGLAGIADRVAYNSSKHGLIGLTRSLAAEWGGRGVRANAVCPGWVKTERDDADQARSGYTDADIGNRVPMGRFATPSEVAEAIAFLADPRRSGFVNGVALSVDGGWYADASWDRLRLAKR